MFIQVPFSCESDDEQVRSQSDSSVSSNDSLMNDECTALANINEDADQDEFLNNDIIAQVLSNIILMPWQKEQIIRSEENVVNSCCLGISPSQFRRLMPLRRNAKHDSSQRAVLYAQIAMQYTFEQTALLDNYNNPMPLIVLIVDAIQKYNFAVFNNKQLKTGNALKHALEEGDRLVDVFTRARSRLSSELAERVTIIRWQDICNKEYDECVYELRQHSTTNKQFAKLIDDVVQVFINVRKPYGHFTEQQRIILREYVLNELPALAYGISYKGHRCSMIFHPIFSSDNVEKDNQRDVRLRLLNYIRHSSELYTHLNLIEQRAKCEVYDIAMTVFESTT